MKTTKTGARLRPMLFSTAMVQAILDGRKTQTRRVVNPQPENRYYLRYGDDVPAGEVWVCEWDGDEHNGMELHQHTISCPYGQPGDILWGRETWAPAITDYAYKADYSESVLQEKRNQGLWKPSIHMPFAAARIFLRVKSVRVERLQDITCQDVLSEGMESGHDPSFKNLWQSINGPESWDANPWVWVVEFERISREEAGV